MNFLGMGPWMMGRLAKQYGVASPKELLEAAQALGVEFIPCQMTMDMFGLKPEDMIDGHGRAGRRRDGHRADDRRRNAVRCSSRKGLTAMTDDRHRHHHPHRRRPRQLLPGPLMELIRAIRESQVGDVIAVYSSDKGSKIDIPKWVEKAGHAWSSVETRDGYDEIVVEKLR